MMKFQLTLTFIFKCILIFIGCTLISCTNNKNSDFGKSGRYREIQGWLNSEAPFYKAEVVLKDSEDYNVTDIIDAVKSKDDIKGLRNPALGVHYIGISKHADFKDEGSIILICFYRGNIYHVNKPFSDRGNIDYYMIADAKYIQSIKKASVEVYSR